MKERMNAMLFTRCHPEYSKSERIWRRSAAAYSGGAEYIEEALIRHVSDIEIEFEERRRRA